MKPVFVHHTVAFATSLLTLTLASCNKPVAKVLPPKTPPISIPAIATTVTIPSETPPVSTPAIATATVITPAATPTAVELDLCSLFTTEEAGAVLGNQVTASSEMGVGGCTYAPTQGFGASLVVSAAQGEDAKALVLLGLQTVMAFSGSEELMQAAQSLNDDAPNLPLGEVVQRAYALMREIGLVVETVDKEGEQMLWSWSEGGMTGTLIVVREDTYVSITLVGLEQSKARSAAEELLSQVVGRLPARFHGPTSTSIRIGIDESASEAESPPTEPMENGSIWVSLLGEDSVAQLDAVSGDVLAWYSVGDAPNKLAAGVSGKIYVASQLDGHVYRIDPEMETVEAVLDAGAPALDLATDERYLYVSACYDDRVEVFDQQAGLEPVITLDVPRCWLAMPVGDSLWVSVGEDQLQRFSQEDWSRRTTLSVGSGPALLVPYQDALFVVAVNQHGLFRIDTVQGRKTGRLSIETEGNILSMTAGSESIWVGTTEGVVRIDPETMEVLDRVTMEESPSGLAVGMGSLWVTHSQAGLVERYDLETLELQMTLSLGQRPWGILFAPYAP